MFKGIRELKEKFLLFKVIHQRDKAAFGELYNIYRDRLYRFIFYKVPKAEDAEDITNEVFFKVWKFIGKEGEIENLPAFLYRAARNAVNDYYRNQGITIRMDNLENVNLEDDPSFHSDDLAGVQLSLEKQMDTDSLIQAMKLLKDEYREVLVMRYLDEMSFADIAEALEKTEGNIRVLIHRATEALKKKIEINPNKLG